MSKYGIKKVILIAASFVRVTGRAARLLVRRPDLPLGYPAFRVFKGAFLTIATFCFQLAAFVVYFLYSSFFEWTLHRWVFHTPRYVYSMFRKHTLVHHQIYKGDETYRTDVKEPDSVPMNWWALPMMIAGHLPAFFLIQWLTGIPSVWGGVAAITVYFVIYESIHWAMHVPRAAKILSRMPVYRYLDAHHEVHHKHMLSNLNVVFPLADFTFGTLRGGDGKRIKASVLVRTRFKALLAMPLFSLFSR